MNINIIVEGTIPSILAPAFSIHGQLTYPFSHRIGLRLCSDMYDLAPPLAPEDTLLVG